MSSNKLSKSLSDKKVALANQRADTHIKNSHFQNNNVNFLKYILPNFNYFINYFY